MKKLLLKEIDISKVPLGDEDKKSGPNKIFLALIRGAAADKKSMALDQHRLYAKVQDRFEVAEDDGEVSLDDDQFKFLQGLINEYNPPTAHPAVGRLAVDLADYLDKVKIEQKDK